MNLMDISVLKWQVLHGSLARRLLLRALLFALALAVFPFMSILEDARAAEPFAASHIDCPLDDGPNPSSAPGRFSKPTSLASALFRSSYPCKEDENVTLSAFRELMSKSLLDPSGKALCVGEGSTSAVSALRALGFSNALGVDRHPFFSLWHRRFVYELDFMDNSFDFVYSRALDRVSIPALFVLEIERVLQPGGIGAVLVGARDFYSGSLVRSATPVSSFLKSSDVVQVYSIHSFTVVAFRKRSDNVAYFERYHLPDECPSISNNKPFLKFLEPLVDETLKKAESKISYLPKYVNISSKKRLIYINIGAGEFLNSSITNWLKPLYPISPQAFNAYVIDHDATMLPTFVKKPGITFVYHPGLAGFKAAATFDSDADWGMYSDEKDFDFVAWFKKTVASGDFVILAMNARMVELKLIHELFESGAICHVDELFLRCSEGANCKISMCGDCMSLFKSLRSSGVYAHQWAGG